VRGRSGDDGPRSVRLGRSRRSCSALDGGRRHNRRSRDDLNFSNGPGGERYITVNGRGDVIAFDDIRAVAKRQSISPKAAASIVDEVRAATSDFAGFAERHGVPKRSRSEIARAIERHGAEAAPARAK
jgi:hypothetical protein